MKTLVLNAGYEPMSVVSYRRAVILVLAGKAAILASDGTQVRSAHLSMEQPAVILLTRYVRPPQGKVTAVSRRGVLRRDGYRCGYCAQAANTVDHIIPRSKGGGNTWENLVACCRDCNNRKGDRTLDDLGWKLRHTPHTPRTGGWWLRELDRPDELWRPYLQLPKVA